MPGWLRVMVSIREALRGSSFFIGLSAPGTKYYFLFQSWVTAPRDGPCLALFLVAFYIQLQVAVNI